MPAYNLVEEQLLLKDIASGNSVAFNKIFNLYKDRLFVFVDGLVSDKSDAEEVIQDVFMAVWQNKERLFSVEHPRNYMYVIARNKAYNYLKKMNRSEQAVNNAKYYIPLLSNNIEEQLNLKESLSSIRKLNDEADALPVCGLGFFKMSFNLSVLCTLVAAST